MPRPLLTSGDPAPFERIHGASHWLVTCEHAGHAVPARLGDLGLAPEELTRHIGWDPGAAALARALAERLEATALLQPYSRLVIDCNRPRHAPDLCAPVSDGTVVPANAALGDQDRQERWDAIHQPFHTAVRAELETGRVRAFVSVHTYDPQRRCDPQPRPWPLGLLWRQDNPLVDHVAARLRDVAMVQPLGLQLPYAVGDGHDYALPMHPEPRRMPHVLFEVRNDKLRSPDQVQVWADLLAASLTAFHPQ